MMNTCNQTQAQQQAGHTKLTAVSVYSNGRQRNIFMMLEHDENGKAVLPEGALNRILDSINCRMRGQTFTVY